LLQTLSLTLTLINNILGRVSCDECVHAGNSADAASGAAPAYYGNGSYNGNIGLDLTCSMCPGSGTCSGHGTCSGGAVGTGDCTCVTGYDGWDCSIRLPCAEGYRQSSEDEVLNGADVCDSCEAGTYGNGYTCSACAKGTFKVSKDTSMCTQCPIGSTTDDDGSMFATDCVCTPASLYIMKNTVCEACPVGANCLKGKGKAEPVPGYWQGKSDSTGSITVES